MERKRKTECLVNRLRAPIATDGVDPLVEGTQLVDKIHAIGEALAYLIEKKHAKLTTKKSRKLKSLK